MNNVYLAFLLSFFAGISTLVGVVPIFIKGVNIDKIICSSLSFASAVMLFISIFDLLPESFYFLNKYDVIFKIFIIYFSLVLGLIICFLLDKNISSDNGLYKVGLLSFFAIIVHNIPEGIITFITTTRDLKLGISLSIAIILHNIPEGISISLPIFYSTGSKYKAFYYTFLSGISELFGAILTYLFLSKVINNFILGVVLALTAGIMIYISLCELLPSSLSYNNIKISFISFVFGLIIVIFSLLL